VTLNNELDVGVDFFKRLFSGAAATTQTGGNSTDGNTPIQLAGSGLTSNITAAALAGGAGGLTWFTTFRKLNLDTVVHALASTSNSKVLSTPVIQTMDNQEADILVGESVPVPVSTQSSIVSSSGTLVNNGVGLQSNIEYQDVAIELDVTPRINPDGYVRMDISQKVNDLGANVNISGTEVPTILKREAKSSVAVEDQSTIVLGGLIQEQKTHATVSTPILGSIPIIGQLFKSQTNNKQRTELIIFIRPTVLRNDREAVAEARRRARMLRAGSELDLEKNFEHHLTNDPGSASEPGASGPQSMEQQPPSITAAPAVAESTEDQRQAAKIKALEEQSGQ
jgi:type II secretory pathway component GspD/PulD (secretin)